jgi:hypothetical protein
MGQGKGPEAAGGAGAQASSLPPIREDLRLYPGPTQRDGAPSWRILDPVRNSFFEIGWLEFELLARWRAGARSATPTGCARKSRPRRRCALPSRS